VYSVHQVSHSEFRFAGAWESDAMALLLDAEELCWCVFLKRVWNPLSAPLCAALSALVVPRGKCPNTALPSYLSILLSGA